MTTPENTDSDFMKGVQAEIDAQDAELSLVVAMAYVLAAIGGGCAAFQSFQFHPYAALAWAALPLICIPIAQLVKAEFIPTEIAKLLLIAIAVVAVGAVLVTSFL